MARVLWGTAILLQLLWWHHAEGETPFVAPVCADETCRQGLGLQQQRQPAQQQPPNHFHLHQLLTPQQPEAEKLATRPLQGGGGMAPLVTGGPVVLGAKVPESPPPPARTAPPEPLALEVDGYAHARKQKPRQLVVDTAAYLDTDTMRRNVASAAHAAPPPQQSLSVADLGSGGSQQQQQQQQPPPPAVSSVSKASSMAGRCQVLGTVGLACLNPSTGQLEKTRWFGNWAYNPESLHIIGNGLRAGKLIQVSNALSEQAAEALHRELWNIQEWEMEIKAVPEIQFKRHRYDCRGKPTCSPLLAAFHTYLESEKEFWGKVARTNASLWQRTADAIWYRESDFLSPHSDDTNGRDLAFNLGMTKDWNSSWGGAFWWMKDPTNVEHSPKFNNLFLFIPTIYSTHMVSTVVRATDDYRRFSINGWFIGTPVHIGTLSNP